MKYSLVNFIFFLLVSLASFSQEQAFKQYSYTEFFKMIEEAQDSIISLKNTVIKYNEETDTIHSFKSSIITIDSTTYTYGRDDFIDIHKPIKLENVHFLTINDTGDVTYGLHHVRFFEEVEIINMLNGAFMECIFNKKVTIRHNETLLKDEQLNKGNHYSMLEFNYCAFNKGVYQQSSSFLNSKSERLNVQTTYSNCAIRSLPENKTNQHSAFYVYNISQFGLQGCNFYGQGRVDINFYQGGVLLWLNKNKFPEQLVELRINESDDTFMLNVAENTFSQPLLCEINFNADKLIFDWDQLEHGILNMISYSFNTNFDPNNYFKSYNDLKNVHHYLTTIRSEKEKAFREESKMLGQIYAKYKREHDIVNANKSYIYLKDLETQHLAYLQEKDPSFTNYFSWKINQFLKVFSAYGTQPAKAIIFSFYVILAFALIYLFFPNSWDVHGKKRIMDRYAFFMKYMKKDAGIHEVYLEDKHHELMQFETFKTLIVNSNEQVPKFFIVTGLPLYKWAISGTKLHAAFLSKIDIMKGTWQNLPAHKRFWKSILLIGAFLITVIYDIGIKILNALMLSINTFTTLGFGEIPIKGLPRYLAIIQGFIGWFMLTIFSVSLISQLLN